MRGDCTNNDLRFNSIRKNSVNSLTPIEQFGITIPSKVHMAFFHVTQWWYNRHPDIPLGLVSEQTGGSLNNKFKTFCRNKLRGNVFDSGYGENLLNLVVAFNFKRI